MSGCVGRAVVVGVAVVVLVCSCSGGGSGSGGAGVQQSSSPVATSSSPVVTSLPPVSSMPVKPQPSETFTSEQLEAANTVIEFIRISDEVFGNPDADPKPLEEITTGQSQDIQMSTLAEYRENKHVQTGATVVHITGASESVEVDGMRMVDVQMCTDVGQIDLIDSQTGKSVVVPGRPRYLQWNVTVVKTEDGWKFGDATNDRAMGCPA